VENHRRDRLTAEARSHGSIPFCRPIHRVVFPVTPTVIQLLLRRQVVIAPVVMLPLPTEVFHLSRIRLTGETKRLRVSVRVLHHLEFGERLVHGTAVNQNVRNKNNSLTFTRIFFVQFFSKGFLL
jgi:hypothetical protein